MTKATTIFNRSYTIEQYATLKDVDGNRRLSIRKRLMREMEGQKVAIPTYTGEDKTAVGPNQTLTTLFTHYGQPEEYNYEQAVGDAKATNNYVSVNFEQLAKDNDLSKNPYKLYILTRSIIEDVLEVVNHTKNNLDGKIEDENLLYLFEKNYYDYENQTHFLKRLEYELNWLLSYNIDEHGSLLEDWDINYRYYADLNWDFEPYEDHLEALTIQQVERAVDAIERYDVKSPADAVVVEKALVEEVSQINPAYEMDTVDLGAIDTKGAEHYVTEESVDVPREETIENELKRDIVILNFTRRYLEEHPGVSFEHIELKLMNEEIEIETPIDDFDVDSLEFGSDASKVDEEEDQEFDELFAELEEISQTLNSSDDQNLDEKNEDDETDNSDGEQYNINVEEN